MHIRYKHLLLLLPVSICLFSSCKFNKKANTDNASAVDTYQIQPVEMAWSLRDSLKLSLSDTLHMSKSFFFSDSSAKDMFRLTVNPGPVKDSKSMLQIITAANTVIYADTFESYYFIRDIFSPDTIPTNAGQAVYDAYLKKYWQSITPAKYEAYFNKNVLRFFDDIYFIEKSKRQELDMWREDADSTFLNEVLAHPEIVLVDIVAFDSDEGGTIVGYSPTRHKVVTLVGHD